MKKAMATYRLDESITPDRIVADLASLGEAVPGRSQSINSVYLDTFDWRLFAENKSLTVTSTAGDDEIQLFDHINQEMVGVAKGALTSGFASDLAADDFRDHLQKIIEIRRLFPCLATASKQRPISVRDKEGKTILRLRLEHLKFRRPKDGKTASQWMFLGAQLTLLPIRGYNKAFNKAKILLGRHYKDASKSVPLHVKGLKKIGTPAGAYSSKLRLNLDPKMAAGDAVRAIHLSLLDVVERNEDGVLKNLDSEFLHDFRVASRRCRSAFSQIGKGVLPDTVINKAKEDFRWLGQQTNHMRDLDVYLIEYPKLQTVLPASYKENLKPFQDYLLSQSALECKKIAVLIKSQRYRKIINHWRAFVKKTTASPKDGECATTPIKALADARIWKTYRRLINEGRAIDPSSPAEALHDLRITGKKLRYLLEFFQSLYPMKKNDALVVALKALQSVLGEFQDTEVQSQAILKFGREMADANLAPIKTQMAMGMVAESVLLRQGLARREFNERFKTFSKPSVGRAVARLFKNA